MKITIKKFYETDTGGIGGIDWYQEFKRVNKELTELKSKFQRPVPANGDYQKRVTNCMMDCFSMEICRNTMERNHRFLEEALELVQSLNCTASEAHQLVDYVFNRPVGEPVQEVGCVMVTLAALCYAADMDMQSAGETELQRISTPEIIEKIRLKQASKPKHSPLPGTEHPVPALRHGYSIEQIQEACRIIGSHVYKIHGMEHDDMIHNIDIFVLNNILPKLIPCIPCTGRARDGANIEELKLTSKTNKDDLKLFCGDDVIFNTCSTHIKTKDGNVFIQVDDIIVKHFGNYFSVIKDTLNL